MSTTVYVFKRPLKDSVLRGVVQILSTVPTIDWDLASVVICGSLYLQLVCRTYLAFWQEKRGIIMATLYITGGFGSCYGTVAKASCSDVKLRLRFNQKK